MARLSGLASDHHAQGPGDAPRKRRSRKSKTPSVDMGNSSKRPASPIEEEPTQTKKAKRVQVDDSDQIARELDESTARSHTSDTIHLAPPSRSHRRHSEPPVAAQDEEETYTETTPPPATQPAPGLTPHLERLGAKRGRPTNAIRRARMSMPAQLHITEVDETDGPKEVQFAPLSAVLDNRVKRRLRRSHLSEEVNHIEDHKKDDAKLRKAYADVRRQLRQMEEKYKEVELELEASRLGNIDLSEDQHEEHEQKLMQELEEARKEIEELKASSVYADSSRGVSENPLNGEIEDDDDELVLVQPEELDILPEQLEVEPLPNGFYASRSLETSQIVSSQVTLETLTTIPETSQDSILDPSQDTSIAISDKISDHAAKRYEDEIGSLATELGTARGALRVVSLQLQNLRIVDPGADVNAILTRLRHVLENAREDYEHSFQQPLDEINNSEFIIKLLEDLKGLNRELAEKTNAAEKYHKLTHLLRQQNSSLLDLQADTRDEGEALGEEVEKLGTTVVEKDQQIADLDGRVTTLSQAVETQEEAIRYQDEKIRNLESDVSDKETDNERLRQALEGYRKDLDKVTTAITRLEERHVAQTEQMENEHADAVQELRAELDTEVNARDAAEEDAQQKAEYIDELEGRIERMESDLEALNEDMENLRQRLETETATRETVEGERDEQATLVYNNAVEIENLTETVQDLEKQIEGLREELDAEREERIRLEGELEHANAGIEELNTSIHDAGIQANELRSKLFQVQQDKDETIAQLNEDHAAATDELQTLLDSEAQRRENAEQEIAALNEDITNLTTSLAETEEALAKMTESRDALEQSRERQVSQRDSQLTDLQNKYIALENSTSSTINSLRATITDLSNESKAQQATIGNLESAAEETAADHAREIQEYNDRIDKYDSDLLGAGLENQKLADDNSTLIAENASLARRVEDEANELLNIMGAHTEETSALNSTIATQNSTIADLQATAAETATSHVEQITTKTREIEELRVLGTARDEHITELEAQIEELKDMFEAQAQDSADTIAALVDANRATLAEQERLAEENAARSAAALDAVRQMKAQGFEFRSRNLDLERVVHGKVTKVTESVKVGKGKGRGRGRKAKVNGSGKGRGKVRDSGFVELVSSEDEEEVELEDGGAVAAA